MKYFVIDCETTGLLDFKLAADDPSQPRLAGVTMIPVDEDLQLTDGTTFSALIQPDGWEISPEITAINGLTTERCAAEGVPIALALDAYSGFVNDGRIAVAYNAQFDLKQIRSELRRLNLPDLFEETPNICAMRASKSLNVEKAGAKKGGFPKLSDVYRHFFKKELEGAHTSESDAMACLEVFRELVKIGAVPAAEVHYAKNRPEGAVERDKLASA